MEKKKWVILNLLKVEGLIAIATLAAAAATYYEAHLSMEAAEISVKAAYRVEKIQEKFESELFKRKTLSQTFNEIRKALSYLKTYNLVVWLNSKYYRGSNYKQRLIELNEKRIPPLANLIQASVDYVEVYKNPSSYSPLAKQIYDEIRCVIQWSGLSYVNIIRGKYDDFNFTTPICQLTKKLYPNNYCFRNIRTQKDFLNWSECISLKILKYSNMQDTKERLVSGKIKKSPT